ncbi:hypothetical protein RB595_003239 [Gaeumannomyces hyphopodioides]
MEGSSEDINSALESFREQWRAEVRAKQPGTSRGQAPGGGSSKPGLEQSAAEPPQTALALYEEAVEMESRGKLGESLRLYRTAFRMDDNVDRLYKTKHFPHAAHLPSKPAASGSSPAAAAAAAASAHRGVSHRPHGPAPATAVTTTTTTTTTSTAVAAVAAPPRPRVSLDDLVSGFAGLAIQPAAPPVEGMPAPPCPVAALPDEVLLHILLDVAAEDVGDFVRLAQVCRRLAFLVATEERIWRRVCLGPEFGFAAMPRLWKTDLTWEAADPGGGGGGGQGVAAAGVVVGDGEEEGDDDQARAAAAAAAQSSSPSSSPSAVAWSLLTSAYGGSWQTMFRFRPRIRFNGCYISTVNYIRAGQASANMVTWNSPVHVCTYFRYLRFFRDGTCISLLTTAEPAEVVPHLTKENLELHRAAPVLSLPSSVMQYALKGRWRLGSAGAGPQGAAGAVAAPATVVGGPPEDQPAPSEEDLFIETEGVGKYMYRLDLALKTAGKGARNNKLVWKGFWSYNRLTDDWAEFGLKNDKAFIFSRVKRFAV